VRDVATVLRERPRLTEWVEQLSVPIAPELL
jgi:hypothetical protein